MFNILYYILTIHSIQTQETARTLSLCAPVTGSVSRDPTYVMGNPTVLGRRMNTPSCVHVSSAFLWQISKVLKSTLKSEVFKHFRHLLANLCI